MKKTYIAPNLKVVEIESETLLEGSLGLGSGRATGAGLVNERYNYDDDEEDEDLW